jgi:hypothetical protein
MSKEGGMMGTKNEPGRFDCYAAAKADEPMFILLARDPMAPGLVALWAAIRRLTHDDEKSIEALKCAREMVEYHEHNDIGTITPDQHRFMKTLGRFFDILESGTDMGIVLKGWKCRVCLAFNGEDLQPLDICRCCSTKKEVSA